MPTCSHCGESWALTAPDYGSGYIICSDCMTSEEKRLKYYWDRLECEGVFYFCLDCRKQASAPFLPDYCYDCGSHDLEVLWKDPNYESIATEPLVTCPLCDGKTHTTGGIPCDRCEGTGKIELT